MNLCFYLFNSKQMATGARPCLSTGHRKQQDFPLWILPPWTLAAGIKSSASTSGPCASCKGVSREGKCRGESRDCWTDSWCDQPRCTYEYRGLLWPRGEIFIVPFDPVQDGKDLFWNLHEKLVLKKKKSESFLCRLVYVWLQALCIFEVQRSYPLISPKNIEALNCYYDCCS